MSNLSRPTIKKASQAVAEEPLSNEFIEAAIVKAIFPNDIVRRRLLAGLGANTLRAAIGSVLPLASLQAMAQETKIPEKKDLKIGFIPITCATPLIMADPLGFYKRNGLNDTDWQH